MKRAHSWMLVLLATTLMPPGVFAVEEGERESKPELTSDESTDRGGDGNDAMVRGRALLQQGRFEEAARHFEGMTKRQPDVGEAWFNLGWAVHALGRYNDAVGIHRKAAMFPEWKPSALYNLASAYGSIGMTNHALGALEQARRAGFNDQNILKQDPAMAAVRKHERFVAPRKLEVKRLVDEGGELTVLEVKRDGDGDRGNDDERREDKAEYVRAENGEEQKDEKEEGGLVFAVQTPHGFDASKSYPVLLAFAPGGSVQGGFNSYWGEAAATRGWIVVSPATPEGGFGTDGGRELLTGLLTAMRMHFKVEGDRIHVAGAGDSASDAFRCAIEHADACRSLTVFPGFASDDDREHLDRLASVRVNLFVGEKDGDYLEMVKATQQQLEKHRVASKLEVVEGSGRQIRDLLADNFMEFMEEQRIARR